MSTPTRSNFVFGVIFVLVLGAMVWWRSGGGALADIPASELVAFSENLTLAQAQERSARNGRPVLVYATASWCPPCRGFKADTLSRDDVAAAIAASFEPVYLDIDHFPREARQLRVTAVPTILVLKGGEQVDHHQGAMPTPDFLRFLRAHAGSPGPHAPAPSDAPPVQSPTGG